MTTQVDQNREDDGRISPDTATPTAGTNQADNSREFKFRAWDKSRGKFHNSGNLQLEIGGGYGLFWQFGYTSEPLPYKEQENWVLQQWTGITDKHGTDIYEGDIVVGGNFDENEHIWFFNEEPTVVTWSTSYKPGFDFPQMCEVIGNVYQNPELMKRVTT